MTSTAIAGGIAFLATLLFMYALLPVARSIGLIDRPGGRKLHIGEIPVTGGLAMFAGMLITVPFLVGTPGLPFLVVALFILVIVGALDDRYDLPAVVRLMAQACAALMMVIGAGFAVHDIGAAFFEGVASLGWFSGLFTVLIVLTAINAFNMLDGSDGIAGGQALMGLIFLGFAAIMGGDFGSLPLVGCLFASVLAFLLFNWPSKRTRDMRAFMGDAGSTMLGFSLAWISVGLTQGESRALAPAAVLWIFAVPLFDFFSSMIRRVVDGRSPFHGDSEHLHHVLRGLGLSSRRIAQVILLASIAFGSVGVAGNLSKEVSDGLLFLGWLVAGAAYHTVFGVLLVRRAARQQPISVAVASPITAEASPVSTVTALSRSEPLRPRMIKSSPPPAVASPETVSIVQSELHEPEQKQKRLGS